MRDKDFVLRHDETGALCVDGVAVRGSALANRVYLILEIVTGTFIANESIGSRLGEVRKATERSAMNAGLYARQALQVLIDDLTVNDVSVATIIDYQANMIALNIQCATATGSSNFRHFIPV